MQLCISQLRDTNIPWRRPINVIEQLQSAMPVWRKRSEQAGIALEYLGCSAIHMVVASSELILAAVDALLDEYLRRNSSGSRIVVDARRTDSAGEWFAISMYDIGGCTESWALPDELHWIARSLEGYIDICTESERSTSCSIHIPTGSLQGWLRRQADHSDVHAIRIVEPNLTLEMDRCLQHKLASLGSLYRREAGSYLLTPKSSECLREFMAAMVKSGQCPASGDSSQTFSYRVEWENLGSLQSLMYSMARLLRLDSTESSATSMPVIDSATPADPPAGMRTWLGNHRFDAALNSRIKHRPRRVMGLRTSVKSFEI